MMQGICVTNTDASCWQAQLDLAFTQRNDKTIISHRHQRGPLSVQRPFYPEGEVCHLCVLHPPGGLVGGDCLTLNVDVQTRASTLLTSPGATKFYRSQGKTAIQQQNLHVAEHASLEWLPQENIYFPGAQASMRTQINLAANARFIGWETHCLGLPANQEPFAAGCVDLHFVLNREQRPLLIERVQLDAERINAPTGLRGRPVLGMLVATPADAPLLDRLRQVLSADNQLLIAATLIEDCLLLRYLGTSTAECRHLFKTAWALLRPLILTREACPPRIWAT